MNAQKFTKNLARRKYITENLDSDGFHILFVKKLEVHKFLDR